MPAKSNRSSMTYLNRSRKLKSPLPRVKLFALMPLLTLTACQTTTGSDATSGSRFCDVARAIYWSRHDTPPTIQQIKEHNAVGLALSCGWKRGVKK